MIRIKLYKDEYSKGFRKYYNINHISFLKIHEFVLKKYACE